MRRSERPAGSRVRENHTQAPRGSARAYRPIRQLARGGMGQVEIVVREEGHFRRVYALKRLHATFADDEAVRRMFLDEARIAGLIRHANVAAVLDAGEDDEGAYLVMDYVEGPSVSELSKAAAERGASPLPIQVALEIVRQAALGLHAAHEVKGPDGVPLDVVHRDVSPQNLLLGFDGVLRVTDFGVARALDRLTATATGTLKGKAGYMSPEQLRLEPVDRRSDLFALGVVLAELLTGSRLYVGGRLDAFRRILDEAPPSVRDARPEVPVAIDALTRELLAKDPRERPANALEVADRIAGALRELRTEEPEVELARFLATNFAAMREAQDALVREALLTSSVAGPAPAPSDGATKTPAARARVPLLGLGLVTMLAGAGALVWALASTPAAPTATHPPAASPPPAPEAPAAAELAPPPARSTPPATDEEPALEDASPPVERSARSRRRRGMAGATATATAPAPMGQTVPRWGWEEPASM